MPRPPAVCLSEDVAPARSITLNREAEGNARSIHFEMQTASAIYTIDVNLPGCSPQDRLPAFVRARCSHRFREAMRAPGDGSGPVPEGVAVVGNRKRAVLKAGVRSKSRGRIDRASLNSNPYSRSTEPRHSNPASLRAAADDVPPLLRRQRRSRRSRFHSAHAAMEP